METTLELRTEERRFEERKPEERRPVNDEFVETTEGCFRSTPWAKKQHEHNPLHVYTKLVKRGVPKERAYRIARWYERNVWNYLYIGTAL